MKIRFGFIKWALIGLVAVGAGCEDDLDVVGDGGVADGGGTGGTAGSGGAGGTAGTGGAGGTAGTGGAGGTAGTGGARADGSAGGTGGTAIDGGAADDGGSTTDGGMGTGQARGQANPPTLGAQIDRAGRPAITTALVDTFVADMTMKNAGRDAYNAAAPATWPTFVPKLRTSLGILDALDGMCGNQLVADAMVSPTTPRYTFLATVLADDQIYVNSASGKCGIYLGVEAELVIPTLPAELKGSCGGRTPTDDVIERSYSVLSGAGQPIGGPPPLAGVDDTVTKDPDATPDLNTFPWLAAPK